MKHLIVLFLILIPFFGNTQQLIFNKTYYTAITYSTAVLERGDGKFFIVGGKLLLTDSTGNLLWEKPSDMKRSNALIETKDHHYLLSGQKNNVPYILKLDSGGNKIWLKEFSGNPYKEYAYSIIETYDSNYVFLSTGYFDTDTCSLLYKINSIGDTLWVKSYSGAFFYSVSQTVDSGFIMAGAARDSKWNYNSIIIKTNLRGDIIFVDTLDFNIEEHNPTLILGLPDGGWIIYFGVFCTSEGGDCGTLIRFDSIGNKKWGAGLDGKPNYFKQCKDGSFIISSLNKYNDNVLYITKLNSIGSIVWSRHFDGRVNPKGNNITETRDGGFVLTGYTQYGSFLIKLDSAGNYMVSVNDIKKSASLLSVYPNPTEDEITFSLNSGNGNLINEITIYNVCGQEVKHSNKLAESDFKLSVNRLDPGIYFYRLTTDDKQVIHGKFILK